MGKGVLRIDNSNNYFIYKDKFFEDEHLILFYVNVSFMQILISMVSIL